MKMSHPEPIDTNDRQLIFEALAALQESTGIRGELLLNERPNGPTISLNIAQTTLQYGCEVKQNIDRFLTLEDLKARSLIDQSTVLVCSPLSSALAARCHQLDIQFIDTAGNAYIVTEPEFTLALPAVSTRRRCGSPVMRLSPRLHCVSSLESLPNHQCLMRRTEKFQAQYRCPPALSRINNARLS